MKAISLLCILAAVHQGLTAPLTDQSSGGKTLRPLRTIVRVSRHRGPLNSFIASEEVTTAIGGARPRPPHAEVGHELIDNDTVDPPENLSPSVVLNVEKPLPTDYLLALTADTDGSGKHQRPDHANWAASLEDVYTDYRSGAPCWRDRSAQASARLHKLAKDTSGLLVILGFGCFIVAVLAIEALVRSATSLRRRLSCSNGAIRLEGPERRLEQVGPAEAAGPDPSEKSAAV